MFTLEEIKKRKRESGISNAQLAALSGVPLGTVQKVMGNTTRSPRLETVQALSAVFEKKAPDYGSADYVFPGKTLQEPDSAYDAGPVRINTSFLHYNTHEYDRQGSYTIEDYLALPDEQRAELIDGVIYDMGAPTAYHQLIGGEIYAEIRNFIRANQGTCIPFMAPTDVQLDCDNRTMVQPDVMIVCDRNKINHKRVFGAPDFVCEVLSPSTKGKDLLVKSAKYQQAGVKEYWLIDPYERSVLVYLFQEPPSLFKYSFEDRIPVSLYDGKLQIDMKEIAEYLSFAE